MNKFDLHDFVKHKNCMDVFFAVFEAYDNKIDGSVMLHGWWCTQGSESFWYTYSDKFAVTKEQYDNWHAYEPKGKIKL